MKSTRILIDILLVFVHSACHDGAHGLDNDGDSLIDLLDSQCTSPSHDSKSS